MNILFVFNMIDSAHSFRRPMNAPTPRRGLVRFGDFAVDLRSGELHKEGVKIKLQEQPFRLMIVLLEHAGEVVTRDELRQRLWPEDTSLSTGIASSCR